MSLVEILRLFISNGDHNSPRPGQNRTDEQSTLQLLCCVTRSIYSQLTNFDIGRRYMHFIRDFRDRVYPPQHRMPQRSPKRPVPKWHSVALWLIPRNIIAYNSGNLTVSRIRAEIRLEWNDLFHKFYEIIARLSNRYQNRLIVR